MLQISVDPSILLNATPFLFVSTAIGKKAGGENGGYGNDGFKHI